MNVSAYMLGGLWFEGVRVCIYVCVHVRSCAGACVRARVHMREVCVCCLFACVCVRAMSACGV